MGGGMWSRGVETSDATLVDDTAALPVDPPPRPGHRLGRYTLRRRLGQGGMGVVYLARDEQLTRDVAVKVLHPRHARDERLTQRVVREGRALAALDHPNIVRVFDIGCSKAQTYVVMEFVSGATLARWWRDKTPQAVVDCLASAGRGLAAAHDAGITHRDFKPANVLVDETGQPRVLDFGLARQRGETLSFDTETLSLSDEILEVEPLTQSGLVLGTPSYMAPEALSGATPDDRTDQYAFAVTLFEGLFGRRPFNGRSAEELALALSTEDVVIPKRRDIPRHVRHVLQRALSHRAEERFPSMAELLEALQPRRRRLVWVASGAALAATVTSVALAQPAAPQSDATAALHDAYERQRVAATIDDVDAQDEVLSVLDDFVAAWSATRTDACLDDGACIPCLDRSARHFTTVVEELTTSPHPERSPRAMVGTLPDPAQCSTSPSDAHLPADPSQRAAFEQTTAVLERVRGLLKRAQPRTAAAALEASIPSLAAVPHPQLRAEASLLLGASLRIQRNDEAAAPVLERSYDVAHALGNTDLALQAALQLRALYAGRRDFEAEEHWYALATALVSDTDDVLRRAEYDWVEARMLARTGDNDGSRARMEAMLTTLVDHPHGFKHRARLNLFLAVVGLGADDHDAIEARALEVDAELRANGVENAYEQRAALRVLAQVNASAGDTEGALALNDAALDLLAAAEDPDPSETLQHAIVRADVLRKAGNTVDALQWYARAEELAEAPGAEPTIGFMAAAHRGLLLLEVGDWHAACEVYEPLADECAVQGGAAGYCTRLVTQNLSICRSELGQVEAARAGFAEAIELSKRQTGAHSRGVSLGRLALAHLELRLSNVQQAKAGFEYAWTHLGNDAGASPRADAAFGLARTLWRSPGRRHADERRALELAEQARAIYIDGGDFEAELEDIDVWLETR